ncbi:hypothetical protein KIPB_003389 [Kipferlia bialata]|uniref:U-box domain-containing protein n=1 Tax=Kipferlia bialata TaxID=797122 RepID=A0A9K3CU01_9EUKA|nr:hypothetical protein KIPB_003389 [Kipferlia bialata]|eukprot:g3389.t1
MNKALQALSTTLLYDEKQARLIPVPDGCTLDVALLVAARHDAPSLGAVMHRLVSTHLRAREREYTDAADTVTAFISSIMHCPAMLTVSVKGEDACPTTAKCLDALLGVCLSMGPQGDAFVGRFVSHTLSLQRDMAAVSAGHIQYCIMSMLNLCVTVSAKVTSSAGPLSIKMSNKLGRVVSFCAVLCQHVLSMGAQGQTLVERALTQHCAPVVDLQDRERESEGAGMPNMFALGFTAPLCATDRVRRAYSEAMASDEPPSPHLVSHKETVVDGPITRLIATLAPTCQASLLQCLDRVLSDTCRDKTSWVTEESDPFDGDYIDPVSKACVSLGLCQALRSCDPRQVDLRQMLNPTYLAKLNHMVTTTGDTTEDLPSNNAARFPPFQPKADPESKATRLVLSIVLSLHHSLGPSATRITAAEREARDKEGLMKMVANMCKQGGTDPKKDPRMIQLTKRRDLLLAYIKHTATMMKLPVFGDIRRFLLSLFRLYSAALTTCRQGEVFVANYPHRLLPHSMVLLLLQLCLHRSTASHDELFTTNSRGSPLGHALAVLCTLCLSGDVENSDETVTHKSLRGDVYPLIGVLSSYFRCEDYETVADGDIKRLARGSAMIPRQAQQLLWTQLAMHEVPWVPCGEVNTDTDIDLDMDPLPVSVAGLVLRVTMDFVCRTKPSDTANHPLAMDLISNVVQCALCVAQTSEALSQELCRGIFADLSRLGGEKSSNFRSFFELVSRQVAQNCDSVVSLLTGTFREQYGDTESDEDGEVKGIERDIEEIEGEFIIGSLQRTLPLAICLSVFPSLPTHLWDKAALDAGGALVVLLAKLPQLQDRKNQRHIQLAVSMLGIVCGSLVCVLRGMQAGGSRHEMPLLADIQSSTNSIQAIKDNRASIGSRAAGELLRLISQSSPSQYTSDLDDMEDSDVEELFDPITYGLMEDPVELPSGHVVSRDTAQRLVTKGQPDPFSRSTFEMKDVTERPDIKERVAEYIAAHGTG